MIDFADVKSVMSNAGSALMGIGSARGEDRSVAAAEMAVSSPAARGLDRRCPRRTAVDRRWLRPRAVRDQRGGRAGVPGGARGGQHHLRCGDRRRPRRRGPGHGDRRGLRRRHAEAAREAESGASRTPAQQPPRSRPGPRPRPWPRRGRPPGSEHGPVGAGRPGSRQPRPSRGRCSSTTTTSTSRTS